MSGHTDTELRRSEKPAVQGENTVHNIRFFPVTHFRGFAKRKLHMITAGVERGQFRKIFDMLIIERFGCLVLFLIGIRCLLFVVFTHVIIPPVRNACVICTQRKIPPSDDSFAVNAANCSAEVLKDEMALLSDS